jgi:hypothetical protein
MCETRRFRPFAATLIGPTGSAIAVFQEMGSLVTNATVCMALSEASGMRERSAMKEVEAP